MKQVGYRVHELDGKGSAKQNFIYGTLPCFHGNLVLSSTSTLVSREHDHHQKQPENLDLELRRLEAS